MISGKLHPSLVIKSFLFRRDDRISGKSIVTTASSLVCACRKYHRSNDGTPGISRYISNGFEGVDGGVGEGLDGVVGDVGFVFS
jgi:hypothetical protein